MLEAEPENELTILDYLNEDCWRCVLDYVPVRNIIRTEGVNQRWQQVVLRYLKGVHISIMADVNYIRTMTRSACTLKYYRYRSFLNWTRKLGHSVVATVCFNVMMFKIITKNCPNLQALEYEPMIDGCPEEFLPYNLNGGLKCLQRLHINSSHVTDDCVSHFIADRALEELEFKDCSRLTGQFLNTIQTSKLKTFVFAASRMCPLILQSRHILPTFNHLGELTKLVLSEVPQEISEDIQLVLDKMPKLEWLKISAYSGTLDQSFEPLCRLSRLKYLCVDFYVDDQRVEDVTRCCEELRELDFYNCQRLTSWGVKAICRNAGARLASLFLGKFHEARDDDVVAIIHACPELEFVGVSGTLELTHELPKCAAAARSRFGPRLVLDLSETNLVDRVYWENETLEAIYEDMQTEYENLSVVLGANDLLYGIRSIAYQMAAQDTSP